MNTKNFVILHSNDMHGDFQAEMKGAEGKLIGGLSLLSGYINKVRREEKNTLYFIAGDMVQGSLIDSEFRGISTIELMNYLAPDAVTLGNHEFDYGLPHLLFLEKIANFPIVNANLYIRKYNKRLMQPHVILKVDGFDILIIGIITEEALQKIKKDTEISTFISLEEASTEIGKICNAYKDDDIDLTILLTHIGFEEDKKLAAMLKPEWGVDMILGGHSHTILEQPAKINGVLIAQAGIGTDQIGRFDIVVDDDTNSIVEYKWQLLPIDNMLADADKDLQNFIDSFQGEVDRKYNALISKTAGPIIHDKRAAETALGNLFADILQERTQSDVVLIGSASIRRKGLGPVVTRGDLRTIFPYDDSLIKFAVTGKQLYEMFEYFLRIENRHEDGDFYQVNRNVQVVFKPVAGKIESFLVNQQSVKSDFLYTMCLEEFHFKNLEKKLNVLKSEIIKIREPKIVATSCRDVIEEFLISNQNLTSQVEGRLKDIQ